MTDPALIYPLVDGHVHNWLVLGPFDSPMTEPFDEFAPLFTDSPTTPRELDRVEWKGRPAFWITATCEDDHQIDWSGFLPVPSIRRAWAFVQIVSPTERTVTLAAATMGSLSLWHNGALALTAHDSADAATQQIVQSRVAVVLCAGANHLLVRVDRHGMGDVAVVLGLAVEGSQTADLSVSLPTVPHDTVLRQKLDETFAQTRLDRAVYTQEQPVQLILDGEIDKHRDVHLRLQRPGGAIFSETTGKLSAETPVVGARGVRLPAGEMQAVAMPPLGEFYDRKVRARHMHPFWIVRAGNGKRMTADERLVEAVQEAARARDLYGEIAKIAMGQWEQVRLSTIQEAAQRVHDCHAGCLPDAVGLSGLLLRIGEQSPIPAGQMFSLREAVHVFAQEAPKKLGLVGDSDQLLFLTAWILGKQDNPAGHEELPDPFDQADGSNPIDVLATWLAARGQHGFADLRSSVDQLVLALSHLADLAEHTLIRELAAVLLDRLLYDVAIHSIHGVYAPARGSVEGAWLRSGRFAPESGLGRLLWGIGSYDGDLRSVISLGLAGKHYQLPTLIHSIAMDRPQSMWAQERGGVHNKEVVHVAHKTPHTLLASLQDYRPGERGEREQIWQATLGPEALIFTNHPTTFSQSEQRMGSWWAGNGVLPRVIQWQDALIALYQLPENDLLGFTHAYFPAYAFDEYVFVADWAFARYNDGYAAIWAAQGFEFMQRGPDAYRELRSTGRRNAWVCQLGNAAIDGDFTLFQQQVLLKVPQKHANGISWQTIRGDQITATWEGPLQRNGVTVDWHTLPHHHSPYAHAELPASHMDIGIGPEVMRLDFRI